MEYFEIINNYQEYLIPLAMLFLLMVVVVVLVLYVIHLRSKLSNFENPRYGFLGKNIYPLIGLITLGSVIIFAGFGILSPETEDIQADIKVDGQISADVTSQTLSEVNVKLSFVPRVSEKAWGETGDKFDIYWDIIGKERFSKVEIQKSATEPSGFLISIPKDSYQVKITVVYKGKAYKFEDRLNY